MANLQNWVELARKHWREFRPELYRDLKKVGQLEAALQEAASRTFVELEALVNDGFHHHEAWEMVRERHLLLPEKGKPPTSSTLDRANVGPSLTQQMLEAARQGRRELPASPGEVEQVGPTDSPSAI